MSTIGNGSQTWTLTRVMRICAAAQMLSCLTYPSLLLAKTPDAVSGSATLTAMRRLGPQTGWAMNADALYWTDDDGKQWRQITPPKADTERIADVFFVNDAIGFALLANEDRNGRVAPFRLAATVNGGGNWSLQSVDLLSSREAQLLSDRGSVSFTDSAHGWLLLRISSGSNFSRAMLFQTADGGRNWKRLPDPPAAGSLQFSGASAGTLIGGPSGNEVYQTEDGGSTWKLQPTAAPIVGRSILSPNIANAVRVNATALVPGSDVVDAHFSSSVQGWALISAGHCDGPKTGCRQMTRLLATENAGVSWSTITPASSEPQSSVSGPPTVSVPASSHPVSLQPGFDACSAPSVGTMQTWWNSPFGDVGIYIGGVNRACGQPNLTASWVSQVAAQGWGFMPIWVGPQAPCSGIGQTFSRNAATARSQGVGEAQAAQAAARALGLDQTVVYYDLEAYDSGSCGGAAAAFVDGWVSAMRAGNFIAGVYGSPYNANSDWRGIANVPDVVWLASWNGVRSVWDIAPLDNSLWYNAQRIHQYIGGHDEVWGGIRLNIDSDVEYAPVARP